jgi:hypothetical protein
MYVYVEVLIVSLGGVFSRATYPILFGMGTFAYFMPRTASNVTFSVVDQFYDPATRSEHWTAVKKVAEYPQKLVNSATNTVEETIRNVKSSLFGNGK